MFEHAKIVGYYAVSNEHYAVYPIAMAPVVNEQQACTGVDKRRLPDAIA
jgi:hypothetical protein